MTNLQGIDLRLLDIASAIANKTRIPKIRRVYLAMFRTMLAVFIFCIFPMALLFIAAACPYFSGNARIQYESVIRKCAAHQIFHWSVQGKFNKSAVIL